MYLIAHQKFYHVKYFKMKIFIGKFIFCTYYIKFRKYREVGEK